MLIPFRASSASSIRSGFSSSAPAAGAGTAGSAIETPDTGGRKEEGGGRGEIVRYFSGVYSQLDRCESVAQYMYRVMILELHEEERRAGRKTAALAGRLRSIVARAAVEPLFRVVQFERSRAVRKRAAFPDCRNFRIQ